MGTIANVNDAITTITINDHCSITANFEEADFMVAVGGRYTVGLEANGAIVAVGANWAGQCDIGNWSNIIWIAAGNSHTVGVRSNGTVVTVGWNDFAQRAVDIWDLN